MKKKKYDFIFSLGAACSCSVLLREMGLQYASFPLDWVGNMHLESSKAIRKAAELVAKGFPDWMKKENLARKPSDDTPHHLGYFDSGSGLFCVHEFMSGGDFESEYPAVAEKYIRRIKRFRHILETSKKVLAVWISDPRAKGDVTESDISEVIKTLAAAYPHIDFHLFIANFKQGVLPTSDKAGFICKDNFVCHAFDYRAISNDSQAWAINNDLFRPLLERYKTKDYRSHAEKRANANRKKARDYEKFKATSLLDYILTKAKFKLYRHLERRLTKKGILERSSDQK